MDARAVGLLREPAMGSWEHRATRILLGVPIAVLAISYVAACVAAGSPWPWGALLHESGDKTLLQTLLYYEHAARELPVDLALAVAAAGGLRAHGFAPRAVSRTVRLALLVGWIGALAVILIGTVDHLGIVGFQENLAQLHTRPGAPLTWGAHWRYHFLSRLGLVLTAWWLPGALRALVGPSREAGDRRLYLVALGVFFGLTLLYGPSLEPFSHPHFLGHQAREAVTHALVTLPLALGIGLSLGAPAEPGTAAPRWPPRAVLAGAALAAGLVLWTGLGAILTGASDARQTDSVVGIVFVHFFEHGLGYVFAPCLAGWLFTRARTA